jgi:DNA-binding transcriptional LysR family regulator
MDNLLALRICAGTVDAVSPLESLEEESSGPLRLSVPAAFGRRIMSTKLGSFMARQPKLALDITLIDTFVDIFSAGVVPPDRLHGQPRHRRRIADIPASQPCRLPGQRKQRDLCALSTQRQRAISNERIHLFHKMDPSA